MCKRAIKAKNFSKREVAKKLADLMGWDKDIYFRLVNSSLRTYQMQEIIQKLEE